MRKVALLLLLLLPACAERWERPGATEAESDAAQARCTGIAAREVPPALVWTQVSAGYWEASRRDCRTRHGHTECVYRPGRYIPPRFDWVDMNTGRRRDVRAACLVEEGFTYQGLRPLRLW